jgi:hypothetical protein
VNCAVYTTRKPTNQLAAFQFYRRPDVGFSQGQLIICWRLSRKESSPGMPCLCADNLRERESNYCSESRKTLLSVFPGFQMAVR